MAKKPDAKPSIARPTIECTPNGPLVVRGLKNLKGADGKTLSTKDTIALCRCGASKKKPTCDGTHARIGFRDEKDTGRLPDRRDTYQGKDITILDNRGICSHAGVCTDRLKSVWRMDTEPWIDADGAAAEKIIEIVHACPSGALGYALAGEEPHQPAAEPGIEIARDGPYHISGDIELVDVSWGEGAARDRYALCRCGASKNKPFCDGNHWTVNFKDDPAAAAATETKWVRVAAADALPEGRVMTVRAEEQALALVHFKGQYRALDNACPHQGGPLGEGTIENGCLRCPWHGWDFNPLTGRSADGRADGVAVHDCEIRGDGLYVAIEVQVAPARTVSDVMAETMVNWGVRHVFGMVGHSNLGLAEALRKQEAAGKITYIGIRHEGAAAFACSGYAKLTGRPAACLTIAGPGATNLLTGLWDAKVDRAPVLALTGQVNTQVLGPGAFQEVDLASAFAAVAAWSQTVLPGSDHGELMTLALKTACIERGVAHLIFPDEVQVLPPPQGTRASDPRGRIGPAEIAPPKASLDAALKLLAKARRPSIVAGYGARDAMAAVIDLAERLNAPVLTTFKAKGAIADDHPLAAGVLGRSGTPVASWLMNEADLLLVFGASFADHTGIDKAKPIIQVDFDRMALGKFHPVTVPLWGEIGITAGMMHEGLTGKPAAQDQRPEIAARWALWREEKKKREADDRGQGVNSAAIFAALTRHAASDAVIAVDVGNNTYSFGRYFECRAQSILMSGYLGSIGFGFPAAMGAWAAAPERTIISVSGDGGFGQYMGEFTTAVKYGMNITHILLNNNELGKISKEQVAGRWPIWQTALHNPDFAQYAELCGGFGIRVTEAGELDAALKRALAHDGPALVEITSDAELI